MSAAKEVALKKPPEDLITPHKLTVAILIRNFCSFRNLEYFKSIEDENLKAKYRKDFCVLVLKLLQSPDLSLEELKEVLFSQKYTVSKVLVKSFDHTLVDMYTNGTGAILDVIESFSRVMFPLLEPTEKSLFVSKSSIVGYFLRRLTVNFEKLTFSEVTGVSLAFRRYYESGRNPTTTPTKAPIDSEDWSANREQWSKRQAALFIATQAALLTNNEEKALPPRELQKRISNLLQSNPSLSEAHFLSYLNYLRVNEFCGAINSLLHCFDRNTTVDTKVTNEEKSKIYRFAVLNLAILHYHFDHKEEALMALKEAIRISQAANDNVCLQHALSWLYRLSVAGKDKLIEHSVLKSFELNLSYTMSLGIQTFVEFACLMAGNPLHIFETLTKSDVINCEHTLRDLISNSYAVKSALWQFYGKTEMSSLWSQLLFYVNIDSPTPSKAYYGEGFCLAICNIANHLLLEGKYSLVHTVLSFAKEQFPNEPNSRIWMFCENLLIFTRALHHENWNEAEAAAQKIAVVNKWEGYLRLAEVYFYKNDYDQANNCLAIVINKYHNEEKYKLKIYYYVRAQIMSAELQYASAYPDKVPAGIITLLTNCLIETNKHHMDYFTALITLHIANIKLLLGMTNEATRLLEKCLIQILSHCGNFDRARATLLHVKCLIANSAGLSDGERCAVISSAIEMLNGAKENFLAVEAYSRAKDVLYLQAHLYNSLDKVAERNQCALELRLLEEQYSTKNFYTLAKCL